jgi:hypothetical protein
MSHISIPLSIAEKVALFGVFLKVFAINNFLIISIIGILAVILMFIAGHFDLKWGWADRETSLNNRYNPEIRQLCKRVKRK